MLCADETVARPDIKRFIANTARLTLFFRELVILSALDFDMDLGDNNAQYNIIHRIRCRMAGYSWSECKGVTMII